MSYISLKWGTLKAWDFDDTEAAWPLFAEYNQIGASFSAMSQRDTPRQKEIICELIDLCDGDVWIETSRDPVTKEAGKAYANEYRRE